ncbi:MAG: hypothetical protein ACRD0J_11715 [Acidimicrobiales bacterium]
MSAQRGRPVDAGDRVAEGPTVHQRTEPLAALCCPVPGPGPGVCRLCRGPCRAGFARCRGCSLILSQVSRPCHRVVPVSLYRVPGPLHLALRRYKDGVAAAARHHDAVVVGAILARFLFDHGPCLHRAAGGAWDLVTTVPSSRGRPGPHPLEDAISLVPWLAAQHRPLLERAGGPLGHGLAGDGAFSVRGPVRGARVLVVDDTWTSGARAQSAAAALRWAGAEVPAVVVVGRVVDPLWDRRSAGYWSRHSAVPFDWSRCCLDP